MLGIERRREIMKLLNQHQKVYVQDLSKLFVCLSPFNFIFSKSSGILENELILSVIKINCFF